MADDATSAESSVWEERVRALATYASLPLPTEREMAVAAILSAWIPDANALSVRMSGGAFQTLVPATVFAHPGTGEGEASA